MTRSLVVIWLTAISLAVACIHLLLAIDNDEVEYSQGITPSDNLQIVFIGSSLTRSALPGTDPPHGILGDGRASSIRSMNHISERITNTLLADAIDSGAETVFLEINAYAHDYIDLLEPAFLGPLVVALRETSAQLRFIIKRLLNLPRNTRIVWLDRSTADETLDAKQLRPNDYYRLLKFEPSYPDELQALLARAGEADVEVFFFSPPRPISAVSMMGEDEFADLNSHIETIAASFAIPLWSSPAAWPDDHFMEIHAHANMLGRKRFQQELSQWYGERQ